jgi:hypothetical protein
MTPTLEGRLQTRIFLAVTVGVLWTAVIVPFLPEPAGVSVAMSYSMAFGSLVLMAGYGMVWEHLYHGLQQWRWDKDWPSVFALLTVLNEAPLVWLLDHLFPVMSGPMAGMSGSTAVLSGSIGLSSPYFPGFATHIGTTWVLIWLFSQGPMRVICVRWRFEGGRIVSSGLPDSPFTGGHPGVPGRDSNDTAGTEVPAALSAVARLTVYASTGRAQSNGTPAAPSTGDLVEGVTCGHGHFSHPGMRYCMVCGVSLLPLTGTLGPGRRPPLGILIFEDGATHVLERDVSLFRAEGSEAGSALAEIRLAGWQPAVSSDFCSISVALPGGRQVRVPPGAPAELVPGAEFTVGKHRVRYESPYVPADEDLPTSGPRIRAVPGNGAAASPAAPQTQPAAAAELPGAPGHSHVAPANGLKTYSIDPHRRI